MTNSWDQIIFTIEDEMETISNTKARTATADCKLQDRWIALKECVDFIKRSDAYINEYPDTVLAKMRAAGGDR